MFQSTHPCGVRQMDTAVIMYGSVSIHAPVWGATHLMYVFILEMEFQSTHPCGVRRIEQALLGLSASFNPRTRVGCDVLRSAFCCSMWRFNPRTRVGCDDANSPPQKLLTTFQSTHPCGVRLKKAITIAGGNAVSIHAPVWGATMWLRLTSS